MRYNEMKREELIRERIAPAELEHVRFREDFFDKDGRRRSDHCMGQVQRRYSHDYRAAGERVSSEL